MLYDPHRRWGPRGICRWEDRGLFFADGGQANRRPSNAVQQRWEQAKEICRMCPVMNECRRDSMGEEFGVFGGLDQYERWRIRRALPKAVKNWPESKRLAWGQEIYELRQMPLKWSAIQYRTGIPPSAAEWLMRQWENRPKRRTPKAAVVDLELPSRPDFPDRPGRRHAWVRHSYGLIADAWYRGETPDGAFIQVATTTAKGQTIKWFPKEDVLLYRPQPAVILSYVGRPDDNSHTPAA